MTNRKQILFACVVGSVPWIITCVYIPIFGEPLTDDGWRFTLVLFAVFAPIYFYFDKVFEHYLYFASSHPNWPEHYWRWTVFAALNILLWLLVVRLVRFFFRWFRLRRRLE